MGLSEDILKVGDALLIIDVQNDFCPGGALPIEEGDRVVPVLNEWIAVAQKKRTPVFASRDWHPLRHNSFKAEGGKWPPHCIEDSEGARFHPSLELPEDTVIVTKGVRFDKDQNSVFDETGFAEQLRRDNVRRLWIGGLAQDVCVLATVIDARNEGFDVIVILDGTRPVSEEGGKESIKIMKEAGAKTITGTELDD